MDKGSYVVMNGKYQCPPDMAGRVWRVASRPFPAGGGVMAVVLEGHGGCYPVDGLHEVPQDMTRIIISGSRGANDYSVLLRTMSSIAAGINKQSIEIVSGDCRGADKMGNLFAERNNIRLTKMPARWNENSRGAGVIRNEEMARYASFAPNRILVCLWDCSSKGAYNMIQNGMKYGIDTYVVNCVTGAPILQYSGGKGEPKAYLYNEDIYVDGRSLFDTILSTGAWLSIIGSDGIPKDISPFGERIKNKNTEVDE